MIRQGGNRIWEISGRALYQLGSALRMSNNKLWRMETGWLGGYTESRVLIRRIRRYKEPKGWTVIADYYKNGRFIGIQYKIPIEQRRPAERMFMTDIED